MAAPLAMLLVQMQAKQQQIEEERRQETINVEKQRASRLGGNNARADVAQFNHALSQQNFGSPQELAKIYGTGKSMFGGDSKPTDGATSTTPGSDGLLNPWSPTGGTGKTSDLLDPYAMKAQIGAPPAPTTSAAPASLPSLDTGTSVNSPDFSLSAPSGTGIGGGTTASLGGDALSLDDDPYALSADL